MVERDWQLTLTQSWTAQALLRACSFKFMVMIEV